LRPSALSSSRRLPLSDVITGLYRVAVDILTTVVCQATVGILCHVHCSSVPAGLSNRRGRGSTRNTVRKLFEFLCLASQGPPSRVPEAERRWCSSQSDRDVISPRVLSSSSILFTPPVSTPPVYTSCVHLLCLHIHVHLLFTPPAPPEVEAATASASASQAIRVSHTTLTLVQRRGRGRHRFSQKLLGHGELRDFLALVDHRHLNLVGVGVRVRVRVRDRVRVGVKVRVPYG
jgi:hypothetical protein